MKTKMDLEYWEDVARDTMDSYGLVNWSFKWDRSFTRGGSCNYMDTTISLSKHFVLSPYVSEKEIHNIILHEVAHALAGPFTEHGPEWKRIALDIGCDGEQFLPRPFANARYLIHCHCGKHKKYRFNFHKVLLKRKCRTCKTTLSCSTL
jgi:SprT protein